MLATLAHHPDLARLGTAALVGTAAPLGVLARGAVRAALRRVLA